jgi:hypothetical protein
MLSVLALSVIMRGCYAVHCYSECQHVECQYAVMLCYVLLF